jgi:KDO2-lipid IV(A) lauroyltransferase
MKRLRYALEAVGLGLALVVLRPLSPEAASNLGGFLGRTIGPHLRFSDRARQNLRLAMPGLPDSEIARIIRGMWENLGRVVAEYPHLGRITAPDSGRVVLQDMEPVLRLRDCKGPGILASAHVANWESLPVAAAQNGVDMTSIVREPNNPYVRSAIDRMRGVAGGGRVPKGEAGAKQAIKVLREGGVLAMLFDQKLNRGIPVPFFGVEAMTAAAPAQLALRFRCPLIPVRIERTGPARFRVTSHPPLTLPDSGDKKADVERVMRDLNAILEDWIRARPEHWLWLHRRWPDEAYRAARAAADTL